MAIELDAFFETVWPVIAQEARDVLNLEWDGDAPGMSGFHCIKEWRGVYFFTSSDLEEEGPFSSLEEALGEEFETETANPELSSPTLDLKALCEIALKVVANGKVVYIKCL